MGESRELSREEVDALESNARSYDWFDSRTALDVVCTIRAAWTRAESAEKHVTALKIVISDLEKRADLAESRAKRAESLGDIARAEAAEREREELRGEVERLRPEVRAFAQAMEARLRANDHKGGWHDCTLDYLFRRLREEVDELHYAVYVEGEVSREAADVANFSLFIADVAREGSE